MTRAEAARRFAEKAEDHYYVPKLRDMYQMAAEALAEEPRAKGMWEQWDDTDCWICSECKYEAICFDFTPTELDMHYCPKCGAKMED